jgi:eukaryotic-like serine/threonine-protein kinase
VPARDPLPAPELGPGFRLQRYELLCLIAAGGMASVWAARPWDAHGSARVVAVKTILARFAADARFQEMFLREGGIATHITHRNVVRVFELGEAAGVFYIAMEYIDGDALSRLERVCRKSGSRVPPGVALRIIADTCAGLHEAHELRDGTGRPLNVVHRDVSPPNILISANGVAKVIDFGIATTRLGADAAEDSIKGKARYMSPEQALGSEVDRRADVWSAGAILCDLLAEGAVPLRTRDLAEAQRLAIGRSQQTLPEEVHPAVAAIARKALADRPQDRFETAAQMRDAIEDAMEKADLRTAPHDVASFAARYLAEQTETRRAAIKLALGEAEVRASLHVAQTGGGSAPPRARASAVQGSAGGARLAPDATAGRVTRRVAWAMLPIGLALGVAVSYAFFAWKAHRPSPYGKARPPDSSLTQRQLR